jgi:hypothetical protein
MLEHAVVLCKDLIDELKKIEEGMRCRGVDDPQLQRVRVCNERVLQLHSAILRDGVTLGGTPHPRYSVYKIPMLAQTTTGHVFSSQ